VRSTRDFVTSCRCSLSTKPVRGSTSVPQTRTVGSRASRSRPCQRVARASPGQPVPSRKSTYSSRSRLGMRRSGKRSVPSRTQPVGGSGLRREATPNTKYRRRGVQILRRVPAVGSNQDEAQLSIFRPSVHATPTSLRRERAWPGSSDSFVDEDVQAPSPHVRPSLTRWAASPEPGAVIFAIADLGADLQDDRYRGDSSPSALQPTRPKTRSASLRGSRPRSLRA
jgi:hypothetical protein